jgi:hypothetical protein
MLWVTRSNIRVNRAGTGWLIRRFLDPDASFCFVAPAQVGRVQEAQGAMGFDAPGARYPHQDALGRCSFEALADEHRPEDGALRVLGRIVHSADFSPLDSGARASDRGKALGTFDRVSLAGWVSAATEPPEAAGLRAIAQGFPLVAQDDEEILERSTFLYDALYATLQQRQHQGR